MERGCQFNAQGEFTCGATVSTKQAETSKQFEQFSMASDAVMAFAANKCPDNYGGKRPLEYVKEETVSTAVLGFDPKYESHRSIA